MGWRLSNKRVGGGNLKSEKQHSNHNKEGETYKKTQKLLI